jgi:integrase
MGRVDMSGLVEAWLDDQNRPGTRRLFGFHFKKFWGWVEGEGLFRTPEEMLKDYEGKGGRKQYGHVEIIKRFMRYLRDEGYSVNSRISMLTALRNLYAYNGTPLPKISRSDLRKMYEPSEAEARKALERRPVRVGDLRAALMEAEEPYRAIFQVMYQSGMGLAEFHLFNREGWGQIRDQLDKPGPMRVTLYRRKTSEKGVKTYYTFIGEEGKEAVKRWLKVRERRYGPMKDGQPIFITIKKRNGEIGPPATVTIQSNMIKAIKKAGVVAKAKTGPYDLHCHELRDIFKSMCTLSGVSNIASEFFLGHDIDRLGYDKSPQYDEEWFRAEYRKVEPKLSVLSNPSGETMSEDAKKEMLLSMWRDQAKMYGIDPLKVRIERENLTAEEEISAIQAEIKRFIGQALRLRENGNGNSNHYESKVVAERDLESYLNAGWEFQAQVNKGKVVVRRAREA